MTESPERSGNDVMFLEVAVTAPLWQTLTYSVHVQEFVKNHEFISSSFVGKRVLVPLGRRKVTGYVLSTSEERDVDFPVKPIVEFLDSAPLFHANLIEFFRWIGDYYHYPIGQVIQTALPGGLTRRSGKRLIVVTNGHEQQLEWLERSNAEPEWFQNLRLKGYLSLSASRKVLADKKEKKRVNRYIDKGLIGIEEHLQQEATKERRERCYGVVNPSQHPGNGDDFKSELANYTAWLHDQYTEKLSMPEVKSLYFLDILGREKKDFLVSARDLRKQYTGASSKVLDGLKTKKLIREKQIRVFRNPFGDQHVYVDKPEKLTPEQQQVLSEVLPAVKNKSYRPFLLHGVTGCGKTEIYLQSAEETLAQGRDVLVLVPEIALATQLEAGFVSRFGDQVVLLHSGLSSGERFDQWWRAATAKARIVIGARSALFAPLKDPGLIVVDEEHDSGFKQDDGLRYQARDLALLRGRFQQSVVLLGSATPSITSYYHAKTGKYTLLSMTKRVADRPLPVVHIVDMSGQKIIGGKKLFSERLKNDLKATLKRSKQSLLLLNRRGFSTTMLCQECGTVVECQHCHISLTYHKQKNALICHYCGFQQRTDVLCGTCRSDTLVPVGFGTERVEEELKELLPEARIERLDSDTASDRRKFLNILKKMRNREIDVLIGTQMIAKGHHFPHVTLVGVVWADGGLSMPDYKASEKTFQLLSQVTGRAGRGEDPGEVIIQTMHPDHYAIGYAQKHLFDDLYNQEINIRKSVGFPPFVRMINIRVRGEREFDVRQSAVKIGTFCRKWINKLEKTEKIGQRCGVRLMGPAPAPIDRLRGKFRWQLLLKGQDINQLHSLCRRIIGDQRDLLVGKATLVVDVDPENMM